MWDLIVLIPDHCFSIYLSIIHTIKVCPVSKLLWSPLPRFGMHLNTLLFVYVGDIPTSADKRASGIVFSPKSIFNSLEIK